MPKYDISRLRKENGMSQNELSNLLQMTQSFLSAIENGKSPLPIEKEERLCEIFGLSDLNDYIQDTKEDEKERKLKEMSDSDLFNQLLNRFHKQAHSAESEHHHHSHHQQIDEMSAKVDALHHRVENLLERNDRLSIDNDRLRSEIDEYRREIDKLRAENYELRIKR